MNNLGSPEKARMANQGQLVKPYETRSLNRQPSRDTIISRISQSHTDVSIQVDVPEADNSKMRRKRGDRYTKKGTPIYSKEDIREQYCINEKELEVLEKAKRRSLFGCISKQRENQRKRSSLLPCVKGNSDESLQQTYVIPLKPPASPTKKSFTLPSHLSHNDYEEIRRRPRSACVSESKKLDELEFRLQQNSSRADSIEQPSNSSNGLQSPCLSTKTGSASTTPFSYGGRIAYTNPNTPDLSTLALRRQLQSPDSLDERRAKHVSFDATYSSLHGSPVATLQDHLSQSSLAGVGERLLDGRKSPPEEVFRKLAESAALSPLIAKALLLEKLKKASMKTQATQTDVSGSRRTTPSSPTIPRNKIRMETRGSQTTLELLKPRKLIKSLSAVNSEPPTQNDVYYMEVYNFDFNGERTRSEEFMLDSASENEKRPNKLIKAYSEGAILVRKGRSETPERSTFTDDEAEDNVDNCSEADFLIGSQISPPIDFTEPTSLVSKEEDLKRSFLKLPPQKSFDSTSGDDYGSQATVVRNTSPKKEADSTILANDIEVTRQWTSETDAHCLSHHASGESDSFTMVSTPTSTRSFQVGETTFVVSPNGPRIDTVRSKKSVTVTSKHHWNVSVDSESSCCPITEKDTESDRPSSPSSSDEKGKTNGNSESFKTAIGNMVSASSCATLSTDSFATALPDKESSSSRYSTLKTQVSNETLSSPSMSRLEAVISPCPDPLPAVQEARLSSEEEEVRSSSSGSYSLEVPQEPPAEQLVSPKLVAAVRKRNGKKQEEEKRYTRYFENANAPQDCVIEVHERSPAAQLKIKSVDAETKSYEFENSFDRKKLKEGLSLQLPHGVTVFPSPSKDGSPFKRGERIANNDSDSSSDEISNYSTKKKQDRRRTPDSESKREILKISMGRKSKSRSKSPDSRAKRKSAERYSKSPSREVKTPSTDQYTLLTTFTPLSELPTPSLEVLPFIPPTPDTPGMVRSPAMHEGFKIEDWTIDRTPLQTPISPPPPPVKEKKKKKARRSDTKSLPGVLLTPDDTGDRSSDEVTITRPSTIEFKTESCSERVDNSDSFKGEIDYNLLTLNGDSGQAVSFESLRSISPGSDSVFLSECADLAATPVSLEAKTPESGVPMFEPPSGFEDSPCTEELKASDLLDDPSHGIELRRDSSRKKRARSCTQLTSKEDLCHAGSSKSLDRRDIKRNDDLALTPHRAHSEERILTNKEVFFWDFDSKDAVPPLMLAPSDDEDSGVYDASYRSGTWMYIGENEELLVWGKSQAPAVAGGEDLEADRCPSDASTASEKDFRRKYTAVTHRLVHRKASMEMFRRVGEGTFECDKRVVVQRDEAGEFGFRIHGSRPVVVSAIEPGTPAEASGLEVGDVIMALNGSNILDASHTDVVRLAHSGANELALDVVRTCAVLEYSRDDSLSAGPIVCSGSLWKCSQFNSGADPQWLRRWLVLKPDNCVYFFRKEEALHPVGAIMMEGYRVSRSSTAEKSYAIILSKAGVPRHILAAEDEPTANRWAALLFQAAASATQHDVWMTVVRGCLQSFPDQISSPDCHGVLCKLGHRIRSWTKYYCVLKDACLYFYNYKEPTSAIGVVFLHGYRVQSSSSGGRRVGFELLPSEPRFRHFHLSAETDHDRKRWLAAMEYSIDRWIRIG